MKKVLTQFSVYLVDESRYMYDVWVNNEKLPQRPYVYHSMEQALQAAQQEVEQYVPPPPGPDWKEQLLKLKKRLGFYSE